LSAFIYQISIYPNTLQAMINQILFDSVRMENILFEILRLDQ